MSIIVTRNKFLIGTQSSLPYPLLEIKYRSYLAVREEPKRLRLSVSRAFGKHAALDSGVALVVRVCPECSCWKVYSFGEFFVKCASYCLVIVTRDTEHNWACPLGFGTLGIFVNTFTLLWGECLWGLLWCVMYKIFSIGRVGFVLSFYIILASNCYFSFCPHSSLLQPLFCFLIFLSPHLM